MSFQYSMPFCTLFNSQWLWGIFFLPALELGLLLFSNTLKYIFRLFEITFVFEHWSTYDHKCYYPKCVPESLIHFTVIFISVCESYISFVGTSMTYPSFISVSLILQVFVLFLWFILLLVPSFSNVSWQDRRNYFAFWYLGRLAWCPMCSILQKNTATENHVYSLLICSVVQSADTCEAEQSVALFNSHVALLTFTFNDL